MSFSPAPNEEATAAHWNVATPSPAVTGSTVRYANIITADIKLPQPQPEKGQEGTNPRLDNFEGWLTSLIVALTKFRLTAVYRHASEDISVSPGKERFAEDMQEAREIWGPHVRYKDLSLAVLCPLEAMFKTPELQQVLKARCVIMTNTELQAEDAGAKFLRNLIQGCGGTTAATRSERHAEWMKILTTKPAAHEYNEWSARILKAEAAVTAAGEMTIAEQTAMAHIIVANGMETESEAGKTIQQAGAEQVRMMIKADKVPSSTEVKEAIQAQIKVNSTTLGNQEPGGIVLNAAEARKPTGDSGRNSVCNHCGQDCGSPSTSMEDRKKHCKAFKHKCRCGRTGHYDHMCVSKKPAWKSAGKTKEEANHASTHADDNTKQAQGAMGEATLNAMAAEMDDLKSVVLQLRNELKSKADSTCFKVSEPKPAHSHESLLLKLCTPSLRAKERLKPLPTAHESLLDITFVDTQGPDQQLERPRKGKPAVLRETTEPLDFCRIQTVLNELNPDSGASKTAVGNVEMMDGTTLRDCTATLNTATESDESAQLQLGLTSIGLIGMREKGQLVTRYHTMKVPAVFSNRLRRNLLSEGQLQREGYEFFKFVNGQPSFLKCPDGIKVPMLFDTHTNLWTIDPRHIVTGSQLREMKQRPGHEALLVQPEKAGQREMSLKPVYGHRNAYRYEPELKNITGVPGKLISDAYLRAKRASHTEKSEGTPLKEKQHEADTHQKAAQSVSTNIPTQLLVRMQSLRNMHVKMGHLNLADANRLLAPSQRLTQDELKLMEKCEVCLEAKSQSTYKFAPRRPRASRPLELVHVDYAGPFHEANLAGDKYFVTFTDDFSRHVWTYTAPGKSSFYRIFAKFRQDTAHIGAITTLRSDNGGEFCGKIMEAIFTDLRIRREYTTPHTPQQNGVSERSVRTLTEKMKCLLLQAKLKGTYWGLALQHATTLHNWSPNSSNADRQVPYNKLFGRDPPRELLHTFGDQAFAHVPASRIKDKHVNAHTVKGMYVGTAMHMNSKSALILTNGKVQRHVNVTTAPQTPESRGEPEQPKANSGTKQTASSGRIEPLEYFEPGGAEPKETQQAGKQDDQQLPEKEIEYYLESDEEGNGGSEQSETVHSLTLEATRTIKRLIQVYTAAQKKRKFKRKEKRNLSTDMPDVSIPATVAQARKTPEWEAGWKPAIEKEIKGQFDKQVWERCQLEDVLAEGVKQSEILPHRNILDLKTAAGKVVKYKSRCVLGGHKQTGVTKEQTYAPTGSAVSLRVMLSLATALDLELEKLDCTQAFLNADRTGEPLYAWPPEGAEELPNTVYRIKKQQYGLKEAPAAWFKLYSAFLRNYGFRPAGIDNCTWVYQNGDSFIYANCHVDDSLIAHNSPREAAKFKKALHDTFPSTDEGDINVHLGLQYLRDRSKRTMQVNQTHFIDHMCTRFLPAGEFPVSTPMQPGEHLQKAKEGETLLSRREIQTYQELVGGLNWAAQNTRPDICYCVQELSRQMQSPTAAHMQAASRCLRYLKGTRELGLMYGRPDSPDRLMGIATADDPVKGAGVLGYSDSDFASNPEDRKSVGAYILYFLGSPIAWKAKKMSMTCLSTMEAELVAMTEATTQIMNVRNLLADLMFPQESPSDLKCDNQASIAFSRNSGGPTLAKHIDYRKFFMKEKFSEGVVNPQYISTHENISDLLTKSLPRPQFEYLRSFLLGSNHHHLHFEVAVNHASFSFHHITQWMDSKKLFPYTLLEE